MVASSRRSISSGAARKNDRGKKGERLGGRSCAAPRLSPRLSPVFSLADFGAAPQLTERLEEAIIMVVFFFNFAYKLMELF